jgi:hypothetical protein
MNDCETNTLEMENNRNTTNLESLPFPAVQCKFIFLTDKILCIAWLDK